MKTPPREHFDYCWPGDAKITDLEANPNQVCFTFDRFTMSLDDPWNESREDLTLGECVCCFHAPSKIEFRLWPDDRDYRIEADISKLIGCTLEASGDMPSDEGHYFELTGFCDAEWFELRLYADRYDLILCETDALQMKSRKAEQAVSSDGQKLSSHDSSTGPTAPADAL
jgi:hypothetical protein